MEVNINSVVATHRKKIGMIGSNLAGKYFTTSVRESWPDFDKDKTRIEQEGNIELITNRSPRRYRIVGHEILSAVIKADPTGAVKVYLNEGDEQNEVAIPVSNDMEKTGLVTEESIAKALRGDKSIIFANASKLVKFINAYNVDELNRVTALIDRLNRQVAGIKDAINQNNKKVEVYENELIASTPQIDPAPKHAAATIVVEKNNSDND